MTSPVERRVLIVDDEEPARRLLREYLLAHPEWTVVGEAKDGLEAVTLARSLSPELLLLDVQMPKLDGLEVLGLLDAKVAVIFTTAFDEHAVRAFEVNAVDYLLKPFSRERLGAALARAGERLGIGRAPTEALKAAVRPPGTYVERLVIRDGAEIEIVPAEDIDFIQSQDDYVEVHHRGRSSLTQETLQNLERCLDPTRFVRVHRSYLLNVTRLARIEPWGASSKLAVLRDGRTVPMSRSGEKRLAEVLGR